MNFFINDMIKILWSTAEAVLRQLMMSTAIAMLRRILWSTAEAVLRHN